jgi:hypothetical protein
MLQLSWDLFIVVIFGVIIAYSFIIEKENTLKVTIGTYLAILTADGLGNLFKQYALTSKQFIMFMDFLGMQSQDQTMITIKIFTFIIAIVIMVVKGGFEIKPGIGKSGVIGLIMNLIFGFLSAGLVISTLLVYVSGVSFVGGAANITNSTLAAAYGDSQMVKLMIDNYDLWFALPSLCFLTASLFLREKTE